MKRTIAVLFLFVIAVWPPISHAQQSVTYSWTAPTTGGAVSAYQFWTKYGANAWTVHADSTVTRSVTFTQPAGTVCQVKVRAFNHRLEAILDANGQMIGQRSVRRYGVDSPYGIPNVTDISAPGGCGRPVKN